MSLSQDITNLVTATNNLTNTVNNKIAEIDNHVNTAIDTVVNAKSVTYYVDALNGNDNNDGSSASPFATLDKAMNTVPTGGYGTITINGNYDLDHTIRITNKNIKLYIYGTFTSKCRVDSSNNLAYRGLFYITNSNVYVEVRSDYNGKIIVEPNTTGKTYGPNQHALFLTGYRCNFANVHVGVLSFIDNYHPIEIQGDNLFSIESSANYRAKMSFSLDGHGYGRTSRAVIIYSAANIANFYGGNGSIYIKYDGYFVDENGNAVDLTTKIAGIVKDSNGVPRNILSSLVL